MSTVWPEVGRGEHGASRVTGKIAIIGGGIAGLSAAWYLQQEAQRHHLVLDVTLLEASDRWGGKILTERVDGFGGAPFILEAGPDALLTHKPWAVMLAREMALEGQLVGGNPANNQTFVLRQKRLRPLPKGQQLLAPTRLWPFVRSPLFSPWGKLRMALETLIPPRRGAMGAEDESLADFVLRRFGKETLETLAEP
ncbi:MAG TPA: protoporphyrinogen oxidase, partial [Ktedonobacterales bacterium]|nr:protoporphyrinogen oxidase [Ktedonobacterales bacterium]